MSTSIRKPRLRPRRASVNFRSFGWLVTRMGCWHQVYGAASPSRFPDLARRFVLMQTTPLVNKVRRAFRDAPSVVL